MPELTDQEYLLYVVFANYLTIFSGVLLLLAFILLGLIALRVSRVFGVATAWPLFFVGPVGMIVYSVYTIVHAGGDAAKGSKATYAAERWIAYIAFMLCGVLCWWGVTLFHRALVGLTREGREVEKKYG